MQAVVDTPGGIAVVVVVVAAVFVVLGGVVYYICESAVEASIGEAGGLTARYGLLIVEGGVR